MDNRKTLRTILRVAVISGLLALPVGASAIVVSFLGPPPNFSATTAQGTDAQFGNYAPYYAWWNTLGTALCVGWSPTCWWLGGTSGSFRMYTAAACSNGSNPSSGWRTNDNYHETLCPAGTTSLYGAFGVDTFPYGS